MMGTSRKLSLELTRRTFRRRLSTLRERWVLVLIPIWL
jgi:hypothetical protein